MERCTSLLTKNDNGLSIFAAYDLFFFIVHRSSWNVNTALELQDLKADRRSVAFQIICESVRYRSKSQCRGLNSLQRICHRVKQINRPVVVHNRND